VSNESFDHEISKALNQSTETASAGFTGEILERLVERPGFRPLYRRPAFAAAVALGLFVLGALIGVTARDRNELQATATQREQLIREVMALQRELDEVRALADEATPILYLGGNETVDLLYDLRDYDDLLEAGGYRPASLPPDRG
jgi:hypothetical protein